MSYRVHIYKLHEEKIMKKLIFFSCLLVIMLGGLLGGITAEAQQYFFTVSSVEETLKPGVAVLYGSTQSSKTLNDESEITIYRADWTISIKFKNGSQVLKNWATHPSLYAEKWEAIEAFSDTVDMAYYELLYYVGDRQSAAYKDMEKEFKRKKKIRKAMYTAWNEEMLEEVEGVITLSNPKRKILEKYQFSSFPYNDNAYRSFAFKMYSAVESGKLELFFGIELQYVPEIFSEVFPLPKSKI